MHIALHKLSGMLFSYIFVLNWILCVNFFTNSFLAIFYLVSPVIETKQTNSIDANKLDFLLFENSANIQSQIFGSSHSDCLSHQMINDSEQEIKNGLCCAQIMRHFFFSFLWFSKASKCSPNIDQRIHYLIKTILMKRYVLWI